MKTFTFFALLSTASLFAIGCSDNPVSSRDGKAFLAANREKPGVITTQSGLQYEILRQGDGTRPALTDQVKVNYFGTLIDGTEFDRGEPAVFGVNQVIQGWTEGLLLMKVGSKYRLVIPPGLAYGDRGAGSTIGPNEVLIFELELLAIL